MILRRPPQGRAFAEVGGKHPRQQGRPPQPMAAGRSARRAVRRRRLGNRLGRHDAVAGPGVPRPRGSAGDETGAGDPESPASPSGPSERAGDGWYHPTKANPLGDPSGTCAHRRRSALPAKGRKSSFYQARSTTPLTGQMPRP